VSLTAWLVVAGLLVVLAGVTAAAEAAYASVSKVRAAQLADGGGAGAARVVRVAADPARYLNTLLIVRLALETAATVLVAWVCLAFFDDAALALLVAGVVMFLASVIAIGVGPRTLGRQHAERVALAASGPVVLLTTVLGPLTTLLIAVGNAVTPGRGFPEGPFATEAELRELVDVAETQQLIEPDERQMIHSVFELGDTCTREVMVPRPDVIYLERHKTLRQFLSLALRSGFSRIPVVGENLDDVVGVVYLKDVVRRTFDDHDAEADERVDTLLREPFFVPDSKPVDDLLREMQAQRTHVAIVVDEYGGTAGVVTIEDILEEIVGEIDDEYDTGEQPVQQLGDGVVRVSARLHIEDLGDLYGIELTDEDVDTVAGLLAKHLGRVPIPGAETEVAGLRLVAESTAGRRNRIGTVLVTPMREAAAADVPDHALAVGVASERTASVEDRRDGAA
jgi:CBS domain containing-hemolysin-like protein